MPIRIVEPARSAVARALLFDVFGTLFDWRTSIAFAWRAASEPSLDRVRHAAALRELADALFA